MPLSDWVPTVRAVGTRLSLRTLDGNGAFVGTFNTETNPTADQVTDQILLAQTDIAAEVGVDLPVSIQPFATSVVSLKAAMNVELAFFPNEITRDHSPYNELKAEYTEAMKRLLIKVDEAASEGSAGSVSDAGSPSYGFPADAGGMVGWGTTW